MSTCAPTDCCWLLVLLLLLLSVLPHPPLRRSVRTPSSFNQTFSRALYEHMRTN
jgi:hypothetical protein